MVVGKTFQRIKIGMIALMFALAGLVGIGFSHKNTFAEKNLMGGNSQSDFQAPNSKEYSARLLIERAYYEVKWNGNSEKVRSYYAQALKFYQEIGNRAGEANALLSLGHVEMGLGHVQKVKIFYKRALSISAEKRNQLGVAESLIELGHAEKTRPLFGSKEFI